MSDDLNSYGVSQKLVHAIQPLYDQWRKDPGMELEVRLGLLSNKGFQATVTKDFYMSLQDRLSSNSGLKTTPEVLMCTQNYAQPCSIRQRSIKEPGKPARTIYQEVVKIDSVDWMCDGSVCHGRVALKHETEVKEGPGNQPITRVRLQQRQVYHYPPNDPVVEYCFTQVRTGPTAVEARKPSTPLCYEVEMELLHHRFWTNMSSDDAVNQLIQFAIDLMVTREEDMLNHRKPVKATLCDVTRKRKRV